MTDIKIAIAGNPNCGKTTLFNSLTGSRQRVGNWPGVTVERMEGSYEFEGQSVRIVDLPGIYSFTTLSLDEQLTREYILKEKPDVVINIVDASNLERNLYLTTQLLEMKVPVVVALNMMDLAKQRRIKIQVDHLETHLNCRVVPLVATKGTSLEPLKEAVAEAVRTRTVSGTRVQYDLEVEEALGPIAEKVDEQAREQGVDARWLAIKLLERDPLAISLTGTEFDPLVLPEIDRIQRHTGDDIEIVFADGRYGFIHGLARDVIQRDSLLRETFSDMVDRVVLFRPLGIPFFFGVMYLVFVMTTTVARPFIDFFDRFCQAIFVDGLASWLTALDMPRFLVAFLANGLGGGIQTIATFIPPIFMIFVCLAILEDSGYMARAAFVMDRLLRAIGLPGKAFLPMLVGFGCNVPAIMATRTLENERDRTMTILINPLVSCGARLPVYTLFAVAFFPSRASTLVFALYLTGLLLAVLTGLLLKKTLLRGEASTFVMELPPYHLPTVSGIMHHTWHRLSAFITRAGRVIIVVVVLMTVLNSVGTDGSFTAGGAPGRSLVTAAGKALTPAFRPMGITEENWPAAVALFTGIFAKEAVIGTLDTLYTQMDAADSTGTGADPTPFDIRRELRHAFAALPGLSRLSRIDAAEDDVAEAVVSSTTLMAMHRYFQSGAAAIAYLLFVLIYAPCVAAIAAIHREAGARWAVFAVLYLTALAWLVATAFYQSATFAAHPATSALWLCGLAAAAVAFWSGLCVASRHRPVALRRE